MRQIISNHTHPSKITLDYQEEKWGRKSWYKRNYGPLLRKKPQKTYHMKGKRCLSAAKSRQSCPTLCDPIDGSPPGSPVPGILQARTLECVAISFSSAGMWKMKVKLLSRVWPSATPWTAAYQAPPSMGFSWQKYWSGVPLPSPIYCIYSNRRQIPITRENSNNRRKCVLGIIHV